MTVTDHGNVWGPGVSGTVSIQRKILGRIMIGWTISLLAQFPFFLLFFFFFIFTFPFPYVSPSAVPW